MVPSWCVVQRRRHILCCRRSSRWPRVGSEREGPCLNLFEVRMLHVCMQRGQPPLEPVRTAAARDSELYFAASLRSSGGMQAALCCAESVSAGGALAPEASCVYTVAPCTEGDTAAGVAAGGQQQLLPPTRRRRRSLPWGCCSTVTCA
eukprot:TRINITY_DN10059_c0_g1_i1.p2 TRINITY_DN10059_c0_g1~~TRINITY_DN10059_c0_g1_i1.p2  ORF type:complete len:148 (-),score=13.07 TRINITY_DN10059_c0_g1_i1:75-518(-)